MNKIFKGLIRFLIEVIVMTVLIVGINIFTNGMYLWGLPRINDIQSVNITYPSVTDDVKEISSSEDIELALKLTGFLKYDLFGEVNSEEEPAITITYFLKDGTSKTISANNTTVWWNNKIHVIKDKEMFVNLTEGIFFLEDLQTKKINSSLLYSFIAGFGAGTPQQEAVPKGQEFSRIENLWPRDDSCSRLCRCVSPFSHFTLLAAC